MRHTLAPRGASISRGQSPRAQDPTELDGGSRALTRRKFIAAGAAIAVSPLLVRVPAAVAGTGENSGDDGAAPSTSAFGFPAADRRGVHVRDITFPVEGTVSWTDTYGACRDGCSRVHEGQDLFGRKGQNLLAAVDGTIVELRHERSGNSLYLRSDANGWFFVYLHLNNDSPGTDNGRNAYGSAFASGIARGRRVRRGQHIAYLGDSGNAESTPPHCHFEIRKPASSVWNAQAVNPKHSLRAAKSPPRGSPPGSGVRAPVGIPGLRRRDTGTRVAALQLALNYGTGARLLGDGQFGPATEAAVRNLQRWCRITLDGIYGPVSQWALQVTCNNRAAR